MGLPGVVEFFFAFFARGRGEGEDRARVRVDRGEPGDRPAAAVTDPRFGAAGDRDFGVFLQFGIDRRVGLEPAVTDRVDPVAFDQFLFDQVEEEGVVHGRVAVALVEAEPAGPRLQVTRPGDVALFVHRPQHLVAPLQRRLRVEERVVFRGRLRQPGDQRRLGQVQFRGRFVEVGLRRRFHPERGLPFVGPVRRRVQVGVEDPAAAVRFEELFRQVRFFDLPLQRVFRVADVEVADQLLGDRRGALDRLAARQQVLPGGAGDPGGVERAVFPEVLVLDRDRGVLQHFRDLAAGDRLAHVFRVDVADQLAVAAVDRRGAALLHRFEVFQRRRFVVDVERPGSGHAARGGDQAEHDQDREDDPVPARMVRLAAPPANPSRHRPAILEMRTVRSPKDGPLGSERPARRASPPPPRSAACTRAGRGAG